MATGAAPADQLDRTTLKAVAVLAGAVEKCAGTSNMASYALKAVLKNKTQPALDFAGRAFNMLEPKLRKRIGRIATEAASELVKPKLPRFLAAPLKETRWVVEHRRPAGSSPPPAPTAAPRPDSGPRRR